MGIREFLNTFPKKHGAWSIFLVSIIIGTVSSTDFKLIPFLLLLVSSISGFLVRENFNLLLKLPKGDRRGKFLLISSSIHLILISFTLLPLLIFYRYYLLIPFSLLAVLLTLLSLYLSSKKMELTIPSEILGIFGLSLPIPAFYYILEGKLELESLYLFIFVFLFFSGSVFHVRYLVRQKNILSEKFWVRLTAGKYSLFYHTLFFIFSIYLSRSSLLPEYIYIAILPTLLKSYYFVFKKFDKPIPLKKIGYTELLTSGLFVVLLLIFYRVQFKGFQ
jgi:hypothetical protein